MSGGEDSARDSEHTYSGRIGWDCPDCDRIVSLYDREFHRKVVCSGGGGT